LINKLKQYIQSEGLDSFKYKCYQFTRLFEYASVLDSCSLNSGVTNGKYEFIAAFGSEKVATSYQEFEQILKVNGWLFGIFGYELKNQFEKLESNNTPLMDAPELVFFVPKAVLSIDRKGQVEILKNNTCINSILEYTNPSNIKNKVDYSKAHNKEKYLDKVNQIHQLIRDGEVYELNYCLSFGHEVQHFDPLQFHLELIKKSPVPMASYLKAKNLYLCGASMERFITKEGNKLTSQPIKGTIKKGIDYKEDEQLIRQLENSEKDRAENVMIVDLVRNDFARVCKTGSIQVEELFGIYSYLQVHQMISTVSGELKNGIGINEILKATFPMGSMTGAPKISSMKHIEDLEDFSRGWYSGAAGYISPVGDFDFNVVIRSLFCDSNTKKITYCAGGAITIDSSPENEWEEIQLKTKAITDVLGS
jgi:para-aminobenzoate synthetase component 1